MTSQSHGGRRLGSGRRKVADVQITARVSNAASQAIKAYGSGDGIAAGVRLMADLSATITAQLPPGSPVWVSFQPLPESSAKTIEKAYKEIVAHLSNYGDTVIVYKCSRDLFTVKARIPLGNDTSLWLSVPARRVQPPSEQEYETDISKISKFLEKTGLNAVWS